MNRKIYLVIASCVIGLVSATAYAARIQKLRNEITGLTQKVPVLAALHDIQAGEPFRVEDLTTVFFTDRYVPKRVIASEDIDLILGRKAFHPVPEGEVILWTDLPEGPRLRKPSEKIPMGYRAISLQADEIHTMIHFITPGDSVDIVSSSFIDGTGKIKSILIAEGIKVLSVGREMESGPADGFLDNYPLSVTLLVLPEEALRIIDSIQSGEVHFLARGSLLFPDGQAEKSSSELKQNAAGHQS